VARDAPQIETYGDGGFRLSTGRHEGSLLILQDRPYAWPVRSMAELAPEHFAPVIEAGRGEVEFVLLGAGKANALPSRPIRDALQRVGIGLEFMDTGSACQFYNILTADGRKVAAALIAV
jgi:uncharacterized protein